MRLVFRLLVVPALLALLPAAPAFAQLEGTYEAIGAVPAPHSQDVVRVEEFLNFTCPHCNNFRQAAKPLFERYGERLQHTNVPIAFRGQPDTALRLYFIAERAGRGDEVKELIFDATFRYGVNIHDPKIVSYIARSAGLAEAYEREQGAAWVEKKIRAAHARADAVGVEATPTIVLNGSLRLVPRTGMQAFVANLDGLIDQLLKP